MKKVAFICLGLVLCAWAQVWNEFIPGVYQFRGAPNTEKFVVAYWAEDTGNWTTVVDNPAQNAYWVVSHGGLLSHPLLDLMAAGADWEFHGRQGMVLNPDGMDPTRFLPTFVYRLFTHSSQNYDSILRTSASFINTLQMEISEIANAALLQHIDTTKHDSLAVNVDFVRRLRRAGIIEFLNSFNATLDSFQVQIGNPMHPPVNFEWRYYAKTNVSHILPMINSGFVTGMTLNSGATDNIINSTSITANSATGRNAAVSFAGVRNGQIQLNLRAGNYTVYLYNLQGRMINKVEINAANGINAVGLRTDNLGRGIFILDVRQAGASVLRQRIRAGRD